MKNTPVTSTLKVSRLGRRIPARQFRDDTRRHGRRCGNAFVVVALCLFLQHSYIRLRAMTYSARNVRKWIFLGVATVVALRTTSYDEAWWNHLMTELREFDMGTSSQRTREVVEYAPPKPPASKRIELSELAGSHHGRSCSPNLVLYNDTIFDDEVVFKDRKIPRIIHFTSKSKCLSETFAENLEKWHFSNHSVYLHDDDAVARLLEKYWPQFPHLQIGASCLLSGAAKADLWRGVILYEYGGIYSDIDNFPKEFNADTIKPDDEAFFVIEQVGVLSQWFFAARPKHPLMYMLVETTLHMLIQLNHVDKQNVPRTTGPGALKNAMRHFMDAVQQVKYEHTTPHQRFHRIRAGFYTGLDNATVRVVGHKGNQNRFVCRNCIQLKRKGYAEMNMKHFSQVNPRSNFESCLNRIYRQHERDVENDW